MLCAATKANAKIAHKPAKISVAKAGSKIINYPGLKAGAIDKTST
jgi:hypothetical protein